MIVVTSHFVVTFLFFLFVFLVSLYVFSVFFIDLYWSLVSGCVANSFVLHYIPAGNRGFFPLMGLSESALGPTLSMVLLDFLWLLLYVNFSYFI